MRDETKKKLASVGKDILITVGILGFVAIAAVSGNAVQLLKYTPLGNNRRRYKTYEINRSIKKLLDKGFMSKKSHKNIESLVITEKGKKLLQKYELESLVKEKPPKWDKKFRVVIFDISEQRKKTRDRLRMKLRSFGFLCLQNSVWIYPYDCQEIIELLKQYLELKGEVIYMSVDSIENDAWLIESFGLKR